MCFKKYFSFLVIFIFFIIYANNSYGHNLPHAWNIDLKNSTINFSIIQNNSSVTGSFKSFTGNINADPDQLADSHIKIIVDMNSVSTSFGEIAHTLKTADWFNVKLFPAAEFNSTKLIKISDKNYQAQGLLMIKDKTLPIILNFSLEKYSPTQAVVKGSGIIKRTDFGLANGEWSKTDSLKNEVNINFLLTTIR